MFWRSEEAAKQVQNLVTKRIRGYGYGTTLKRVPDNLIFSFTQPE